MTARSACRIADRGQLFGRIRTSLTGNRLQKVNDLLLPRGGRIKLATHLREPLVDLREPLINMIAEVGEIVAEVDEVFSKRVEARGRSLAKIAEIAADRAHIAISSSGEHSRSRSVALACFYAPGQVAHLPLESGNTRFEFPRLHTRSVPAPAEVEIRSFAYYAARDRASQHRRAMR